MATHAHWTTRYDGGEAVFDIFRHGEGWIVKRRGDPASGVITQTLRSALELGASMARRHALAELIVRDETGAVAERYRLGFGLRAARRDSRLLRG